jgi:DNA polymerase-3 subunit delta'
MVDEPIIAEALVHREQVDPNLAAKNSASGTGINIRYTYYDDNNEFPFEQWFVTGFEPL